MKYKLLGQSGLRVSELALGTMTFGTDWGWGADEAACRAIFKTYIEAGGNFIDTANFYTNGTSETFVGEFIASAREQYVVATKFTLGMRSGDLNSGGNHRKNIMRSVEASLKRLNTDYIDLYWLHAWDFTTRPDEVMRALDDLVSQGKIMYIGVSDTPAWIVSQMNIIAELRGWTPFVGLQIEYSLIERTVERDLIPMARAFGMSVLAWSPLGAGVLTGKYNKGDGQGRVKKNDQRLSERNLAIAAEVVAIAEEIDATPAQVAIAWLQHKPSVITIIGATKQQQIEDNLKSINVTLSAEHMARLDDISAVDLGFPHAFLRGEGVQNVIFAGQQNNLIRR